MPTKIKQQNKTPRLRFPGFSGEWEEKKLEDVGEINPSSNELPDKFVYIDLESVENGILNKENEINKIGAPSRAQRVLQKKDILFQMVRPYQQNNLYFDLDGSYVASTGYGQIRTENNSMFLYQYLHISKFLNNVLVRCTGTNYPAINSNDFKKISINIPALPEQQKIAEFLGTVDAWISNMRSQKESLDDYKKGMMQKIFSQEIRFKDDNGKDFPKWKEKKLEEVFTGIRGQGLSKDIISENGRNECILYGELYTTYVEVIHEIKSRTDSNIGLKSEVNDLLIPCSTTTTGIDLANVTALNKKDILLGGDMTVLRSKILINNIFYAYYLSNYKKFDIAKYAQGVTIIHLYYNHIKKMMIDVPSFPEQQKIADFLTAIDNLINLKQQQIKQAEQWKKGLMQGLFV